MTLRYPIPKLLRFSVTQWRAIVAHCKATKQTPTTFIRDAVARELVFTQTRRK